MCLAAVAFHVAREYPIIIAANRDEQHARPSAAAHWWDEPAGILGGRDLLAGGSWLAIGRDGRMAAVTNVRDAMRPDADAPLYSRGLLVRDYLATPRSAAQFVTELEPVGNRLAPFNLLVLDSTALHYCSNRAASRQLRNGVHVLSNAPLGTRWPKVRDARHGVEAALESADPLPALLALLGPESSAAAGVGPAQYEASIFISGGRYGTRASTVVLLSATGELTFVERRFDAAATVIGETAHRFFLDA